MMALAIGREYGLKLAAQRNSTVVCLLISFEGIRSWLVGVLLLV